MDLSNQQFNEAILFLLDVWNKSETEKNITEEIEFIPTEIEPFKVLTNAGKLFEQYSGLHSYDELHTYLREHLGDWDDYDFGMPLMHITAVCDAIKNVFDSAPNKIDESLGNTKNDNIRDLILFYSKSA